MDKLRKKYPTRSRPVTEYSPAQAQRMREWLASNPGRKTPSPAWVAETFPGRAFGKHAIGKMFERLQSEDQESGIPLPSMPPGKIPRVPLGKHRQGCDPTARLVWEGQDNRHPAVFSQCGGYLLTWADPRPDSGRRDHWAATPLFPDLEAAQKAWACIASEGRN